MSPENPTTPSAAQAESVGNETVEDATAVNAAAVPADFTAVPSAEAGEEVRAVDVVDPALVRKAPKFRSFILAGVFGGLILGLLIGVPVFWNSGNSTYKTIMLMVDLALVATAVALLWAIRSDRRSTRATTATKQN